MWYEEVEGGHTHSLTLHMDAGIQAQHIIHSAPMHTMSQVTGALKDSDQSGCWVEEEKC